MNSADLKIFDFSPHLFWDIDANEIDFDNNKDIVIQRILQYGFFSDWSLIYKYYGLDVIVEVAKGLRDLDDKSIYFISSLSNTPLDAFLCYTMKQSTPRHWDF